MYDVAVDEEVRSGIKTQFKEIRTQVGENPKEFFPILGEVALTVLSGNSLEEWKTTVSGKYEDVKFGCLDIATQKVVFIQDFSQENDEMFDAPIFHEGKLYLKGIHYNNLYVFE